MDFKSEITRLKRVVYFLNRTSTTIINNLVTTITALTDVSIYEPDGGQVLMYNETTEKWENEPINQAHTIQGSGVSVTQRTKLNFIGATVADDPSAGATKVTITGGGGSGSGTVNSGTQYRIAYYATTGTAVSEASAITASRALKSDANGVPTHFDTATEPTLTELSYVKGVTSSIQTQINTIGDFPLAVSCLTMLNQ